MKKVKKIKKVDMIWVVAYINMSQLCLLERDLNKSNQYSDIEAYIPTIKVLKKQFKGKDIFDEVPLLLNYGFFRIPLIWAANTDLLAKLKEDLSCIAHWVKDPLKPLSKTGREFNEELHTYKDRVLNHLDVSIATAKDFEITALIEVAKLETVYSSDDIEKLKPGVIITLVGYPFEGMEASVISVDKKRKKVWVTLDINMTDGKVIEVSFDNVFYSIYKGEGNYNEDYKNPKEENLEDWKQNKKNPKQDEGTEDNL